MAVLGSYEPQCYALMRIVTGFLFLWHGSQKVLGFPPMPPNAMLSTRSCRTSCQRLAPTATRTLISPERPAAFASRRLATFEQAISKTNATAPSKD